MPSLLRVAPSRPEVVWAAVTQPESFARWYAFGGAEIDLRPGGLTHEEARAAEGA